MEKPYQIRFPDPSVSVPALSPGVEKKASKPPAKERPITYYTLTEGTTLRTGPLGGTGEFIGHIDKTATVRSLRSKPVIIDGMSSFWVEVESPPDLKGKRYWVTKSSKGVKGFLKASSSKTP